MVNPMSGEYDTLTVRRYSIAGRPDGRKALLIETKEGRRIAFEIPQEILRKLASDLATLAAQPEPPNKPNA